MNDVRQAVFAACLVAAFVALALAGLRPHAGREAAERSAAAALRSVAFAEEDFRTNDRDRNGVLDYWTADLAGLHGFHPPGETAPLRLISAELAGADDRRPDAAPFGGYWFSAGDRGLDNLFSPPPGIPRHPDRFGFTAYPAGRTRGAILGVNESTPVYRWDARDTRRRWPSDAQLKAEYSRPD